MKKFGMQLLMAVALLLTGCHKKDEPYYFWDFNPVILSFDIVNSQGEDMLDYGQELYKSDLSILYEGEKYEVQWDGNGEWWPPTRYYMPMFYGLTYFPARDGVKAKVSFGEFAGEACDVDLTLCMPDGSKHEVHVSREIRTKKDKAFVTQTVTLDGDIVDQYTDGSPYVDLSLIYE